MRVAWLAAAATPLVIVMVGVACVGETPGGVGLESSSGEEASSSGNSSSGGGTSSSGSSSGGGTSSSGGSSSGESSSSSSSGGSSGSLPDSGPAITYVFITSALLTGDFAFDAATPWAAADAICAAEALGAGLPGTYRAALSYTSGGTDFNAVGRIADTAYWLPGTVSDPAPVQIAANRADLFEFGPTTPINRLASGAPATAIEGGNKWTWTGSDTDGVAAFSNCKSWTSASSTDIGVAGNARDRIDASSGPSDWITLGTRQCSDARRLYCFGVP